MKAKLTHENLDLFGYKRTQKSNEIVFKKDFDIKHGILDRFIQITFANNIYRLSFGEKGQSKSYPSMQIETEDDLNTAIDNFIAEYKNNK